MQPIFPDSFPSLRVRWDRRLVLGFHERVVAMLTRFGIWRMSRAGDLVSLVSRVPRRLSHLRRSGRSTRCLNLRERATQLNREPPEQVAAMCPVTGLAGPLERRSGGSNPAGADRQCGSVQLVRCCRQARQVAVLRSLFNLALGL